MDAEQAFKTYYNGRRNFMTPEIIRYGSLGYGYKYELSEGRGIDTAKLYGVTIVHVAFNDVVTKVDQLSQTFNSELQAKAYINGMTQMLDHRHHTTL